jgi:hypothetical protein
LERRKEEFALRPLGAEESKSKKPTRPAGTDEGSKFRIPFQLHLIDCRSSVDATTKAMRASYYKLRFVADEAGTVF